MLSHFSHVWLSATPWTMAHQAPLSLGFSRQEYWSGLPFPSPVIKYEVSEVKSLSHVRLFATPWTVAYQAPPSMGFSRQGYWSGLPSPSPETTLDINNLNLNFKNNSTNLKLRTQIAFWWESNFKSQLQTLEINDNEKEHKHNCFQEENLQHKQNCQSVSTHWFSHLTVKLWEHFWVGWWIAPLPWDYQPSNSEWSIPIQDW